MTQAQLRVVLVLVVAALGGCGGSALRADAVRGFWLPPDTFPAVYLVDEATTSHHSGNIESGAGASLHWRPGGDGTGHRTQAYVIDEQGRHTYLGTVDGIARPYYFDREHTILWLRVGDVLT